MFDPDRQFKSDMGRILANAASGLALRAGLAAMAVYGITKAYGFVTDAFAPIQQALGG